MQSKNNSKIYYQLGTFKMNQNHLILKHIIFQI